MTKFKVGDKVRILDVKSIDYGSKFWLNGDVTKVTDVEVDGGIYLATPCSKGRGLYVTKAELRYIDLAPQSPTKNQRLTDAERTITTLESEVSGLTTEVAELKAKVEALEALPKPTEVAEMFALAQLEAQIKATERSPKRVKPKSPNERRKAIIAEAKAFVEEVTKRMASDRLNTEGNVTFRYCTTKPEFHVNSKKRTVVALVKGLNGSDRELYEKAIAKCAPDDVFNADIGKAIALGRALGLDVSRFEQAVKPTEVVVGHVVADGSDDVIYNVVPEFSMDGGVLSVDFCRQINRRLAIIDDTEAKY